MSASPELWDQWANIAFINDFLPDMLPTVGKRPVTKNWTKNLITEADIQSWRQADYNIGIRASYLRAIDIDIPDDAIASQVTAFIRMRHPMPLRFRSGTGKCLLAFCMQGNYDKLSFKTNGGGIEFLANKQQFVVAGVHPDGSLYEWLDTVPEDFPLLTKDQFESLWFDLQQEFSISPTGTSTLITPLDREPNPSAYHGITDDVADYLRSNNLVAKEDAGRLHLHHCPWEDQHTDKRMELTQTTYFVAKTNGYSDGAFDCRHEHCRNRTKYDFELALGYTASDFDIILTPENYDSNDKQFTNGHDKSNRFVPIQAADFVERAEPEWIIDDILPQSQFGLLFGASGTYKTFVALDMALSIASGKEWNGKQIKQGPVLYICGEAVNGARMRVKAWAHQYGLKLQDIPFRVVENAPNLLLKEDVAELLHAVAPFGPCSAIFIDTLAQSTPGGDENNGKDMTRALSHCRVLSAKTGAMVMMIHHAGKDLSKGARGWSGLKAAADVEFEMTALSPMCSSLTVSKQKDGETGLSWRVQMLKIELGLNSKGKEISTLLPTYFQKVIHSHQDKKPSRKGFWKGIISEQLDILGIPAITNTLIEAAMKEMPHQARNIKKQSIDRALEAMQLDGDITITKEGFILRPL